MTFDDVLIAADAHPYQHCTCGHLRSSHRGGRCFMCWDWGGCMAFELCAEHPGVEDWRRLER